MKLKINHILPIAFSILLPIIGFYSRPDHIPIRRHGILANWISSTIVLYILWHLLLYLSKIKFYYKKLLLLLLFFVTAIIVGEYVFGFNMEVKAAILARLSFASSLILTIQYALKSQKDIANLQLEKEQIQTENYKAQLNVLQTKIDPHFLFNSLNTLRSMVRQGHENSEKFIINLSDIYRQTLQHSENTTIQLSEELELLESYLFLMKSRNEKAIAVSITIDESLNSYQLPSLALQTVVENCFKHNSMTSKMPLHIEISHTAEEYILVKNNLQPKIGEQKSSGYGLEFLKKRYELLNISKGILIKPTPNHFSVLVKLIKG